jgi:hypothetical protein
MFAAIRRASSRVSSLAVLVIDIRKLLAIVVALKHASYSSTDHGGGKRRAGIFLNHSGGDGTAPPREETEPLLPRSCFPIRITVGSLG